MKAAYETSLYRRMRAELGRIRIVDTHEHLQRESELQQGGALHLGRLFAHYAVCDLVSAGMPAAHKEALINDSRLAPRDRWRLVEPWYRKAWNTAYCECLRIALRDLYGIEDFSDDTAEKITAALRRRVKPGFTRRTFDRAGIDFAMNNPFGPRQVFNPDFDPDSFICDMVDGFTHFPIQALEKQTGARIRSLDDYLDLTESFFDKYARCAGAFKVGRAYDRPLSWEEVPESDAKRIFRRLRSGRGRPGPAEIRALEDFMMHRLCQLCGRHGLRMKFHTGIQEGNGNNLANSRAQLLTGLFLRYPRTGFDIYHISYPYEGEAAVLAKNFPNVTVNFCWMWIINPAAGRRALSEMLDTVPVSKIHGFGGDFIFVEGTYGHAEIARREIARVLCEKVEEGRFTEAYAAQVGRMLLRDNALENFGLEPRRKAFRQVAFP